MGNPVETINVAQLGRRVTILLVEDNYANRDMLTRRLQHRGFHVCVAIDGPSGVAMAETERPDVILMDVALGEMNGWEATQLIKSCPTTANIPVIALTAHALATDREKSIAVGCADFDTKPVDLTRLLGKISACLRRGGVEQHASGEDDHSGTTHKQGPN
jgi:CheY-like chemotaxis protein